MKATAPEPVRTIPYSPCPPVPMVDAGITLAIDRYVNQLCAELGIEPEPRPTLGAEIREALNVHAASRSDSASKIVCTRSGPIIVVGNEAPKPNYWMQAYLIGLLLYSDLKVWAKPSQRQHYLGEACLQRALACAFADRLCGHELRGDNMPADFDCIIGQENAVRSLGRHGRRLLEESVG